MTASLNEKLRTVKWGEFKYKEIFNNIKQGRRLKKNDQKKGEIPFVMAGTTNNGVVGYISNPVASFPKNSITIDIFGNTFYRDYAFGAGDDTGVYWNDAVTYSSSVMLFLAVAMQKSLLGKFSFGKKLRSSQSDDFVMFLPTTKTGEIDFNFMESFIAELEAERVAELSAYLTASGLDNYELSEEEKKALDWYETQPFEDFDLTSVFDVKNTANLLSEQIVENSGSIPYLCASAENNGVNTYIDYDRRYLERGNCVFIGGKTFTVSYQKEDFFSNDSHNLALYVREYSANKSEFLYLTTCVRKSLSHKYTWGDSVSKTKIKTDKITLPSRNGTPDYQVMELLISAIQKLVIKDVVQYADQRISGMKQVIK